MTNVAVCVYGAKLAMDLTIGFEVIVAFIMYVSFFTSPLSTIAQGMTQMQSAADAGTHIFGFLEEELEDESDNKFSPDQAASFVLGINGCVELLSGLTG